MIGLYQRRSQYTRDRCLQISDVGQYVTDNKLRVLCPGFNRTSFRLAPVLGVIATTSTPVTFLWQFAVGFGWSLDHWVIPGDWGNYVGLDHYKPLPIPDNSLVKSNTYLFDEQVSLAAFNSNDDSIEWNWSTLFQATCALKIFQKARLLILCGHLLSSTPLPCFVQGITLNAVDRAISLGKNFIVHIGNPFVKAPGGLFDMIGDLETRVAEPSKLSSVIIHGSGRAIKCANQKKWVRTFLLICIGSFT